MYATKQLTFFAFKFSVSVATHGYNGAQTNRLGHKYPIIYDILNTVYPEWCGIAAWTYICITFKQNINVTLT